MFWKLRREKSPESVDGDTINEIELPPLEELENWVLNIVVKLKLEAGEFTFLPAYGGIILFLKGEGLTWLPYSEIKDALGELDKNRLVDNTTTIGVAIAAGPHLIPALLVHRFLKGSYRVLAKPSPKTSMSFLISMIEKVIIEETKLREGLLDTFEETPYKTDKPVQYSTYVVKIKRHFLDKNDKSVSVRFLKGIMTFISGSKEPVFAIPPQADVSKFASILQTNGIEVEWRRDDLNLLEGSEEYTVDEIG